MKGHAQAMFIDMILMGVGLLLVFQGLWSEGLGLFLLGFIVHEAMGGLATGF